MPEPLLQLTPHPARAVSRPGRRGGSIAALDTGPADDSRGTCLLLPGFTGSKEDFAPLFGPLAERGWRMIAIDLPGQHESTGSAEHTDFTVDRLADEVTDIGHAVPMPVHLLGHSFGGLVARAAVIAAPYLWSSLVLLDSGPSAITGARRQRLDALEPLLASGGVEGVYAANEELVRADPAYVAPPPALQDFLRRRFLDTSAASLRGMGSALRTEPDRVAELRAADVPTLVCWGADDDAWSPEVQAEMAERLGAATAVIPDAVHSPAVQNPAATIQALDSFWDRVSLDR